MKIIISETEKLLEIEKSMEKEYRKDKLVTILTTIIFFLIGITIIVASNFYPFTFLFCLLWGSVPIISFKAGIYRYCKEIIKIENGNKIKMKFIFKNKFILEEEIEIENIKKIEVVKTSIFSGTMKIVRGSKAYFEAYEPLRKLKIVLSNGKIYSWGVDVSYIETQNIKLLIENYLEKLKKTEMEIAEGEEV